MPLDVETQETADSFSETVPASSQELSFVEPLSPPCAQAPSSGPTTVDAASAAALSAAVAAASQAAEIATDAAAAGHLLSAAATSDGDATEDDDQADSCLDDEPSSGGDAKLSNGHSDGAKAVEQAGTGHVACAAEQREGHGLQEPLPALVNMAGKPAPAPGDLMSIGPEVSSTSHRAEYQAFTRACNNVKKCPVPLAKKFHDKATRQQMFNDWIYNGKDLTQLDTLYRRVETFRTTLKDNFGFRTRDDLVAQYHQRQTLVDDLIARKVTLGHWRPHPEFPHHKEMLQYWVRLSTERSDAHETMEQWQFDILTKMDRTEVSHLFAPQGVPGLAEGATGDEVIDSNVATASPDSVVAGAPPPGKGGKRGKGGNGGKGGGKGSTDPVSKQAQRALPTSPFKKGGILLKQMNKYACTVRGISMQLKALKYQTELKGKLDEVCSSVEDMFNQLQKLQKDNVDDDYAYTPLLERYTRLKYDSMDDLQEAQGVVEGANKPAKKVKVIKGTAAKSEA